MTFTSVGQIQASFASYGCSEILIKPLADNQDNEKNQIYLGYSHELFSLLPGKVSFRSPSESKDKTHSSYGKAKIENALNLYWIENNRKPELAPNSKIIDYFQYPEMRLSGFLSGCANPPDALRRDHQEKYGKRILLLGMSGENIYATVVTETQHDFFKQLLTQPKWPVHDLLLKLKINMPSHVSDARPSEIQSELENSVFDFDRLLFELKLLGSTKYPSSTLKENNGQAIPFRGNQGAGWTLESLLNIPRNSSESPDKYGFELKTFLSNKITLMTPEPDFGYRYEEGLESFLNKFGWIGTKNDGSYRFNGKHNTQSINKKSGLLLQIENWDYQLNAPTGKGIPNVLLVNPKTDEVAAGWSFEKLARKWGRKHAGAMYITAQKHTQDSEKFPSHYSFGPMVYCGLGTSTLHLMRGIASGFVYLDPGDRINSNGEEKKRSQWRVDKIPKLNFGKSLAPLYDEMRHLSIY